MANAIDPKTYLRKLQAAGLDIPTTYIVLDVETTGFDKYDDLIWNFGAVLVRHSMPVEQYNIVLDISAPDVASREWVLDKCAALKRHAEESLGDSMLTIDKVAGKTPFKEGMQQIATILERIRDEQLHVVGHCLVKFDAARICRQVAEFTGKKFLFSRSAVTDTGAIEKGLQLGKLPTPGVVPVKFWQEVFGVFATVPFSLSRHCWEKYDLQSHCKLRPEDRHSALADCLATHCLLERYREIRDN